MDHIIELRKRVALLEKQLENALAWVTAKQREEAAAIDEIKQLRKAMDVQGNAVKVLHQAETSELNHLRKTAQEAYMAKMTLDSEREANRILTDEIEQLRNNQSILITSFRINMMRLCPEYSHEEFDKDIAALLKEKE
jgi:hypothetical protein